MLFIVIVARMIEVLNAQAANEFEATEVSKNRSLASWPLVADTLDAEIRLGASVKYHGLKPRGIGILLLAEFESPLGYQQFPPIETGQGPLFQEMNNVLVESLYIPARNVRLPDQYPHGATETRVSASTL